MHVIELKEFKQFKAWSQIQEINCYNSSGTTKVKNVEMGLKNRKAKFSDEVEKNQSAKTNI